MGHPVTAVSHPAQKRERTGMASESPMTGPQGREAGRKDHRGPICVDTRGSRGEHRGCPHSPDSLPSLRVLAAEIGHAVGMGTPG